MSSGVIDKMDKMPEFPSVKIDEFDEAEFEEFAAECKEDLNIPEEGSLLNLVESWNNKLLQSIQNLERNVTSASNIQIDPGKHLTPLDVIIKRSEHLYQRTCLRRNCAQAQDEFRLLSEKVEALESERNCLTKDKEYFLKILKTITGLYSEAFKVNVEVLSISEDEYKGKVGFYVNDELAEHTVIMTIDFRKKELTSFDVESFCTSSEISEFQRFYEETKNLPKLTSMLRAKILELHESKKNAIK